MKGSELRLVTSHLIYPKHSACSLFRKIRRLGVSVLAVVLAAGVLTAGSEAQVPYVVVSQLTSLAELPSGGAVISGGDPAGSSIGVNPMGNVVADNTYNSAVFLLNGTTATVTPLGTYSNPGPVAVDKAGNAYLGATYNTTILKLPYNGGAYEVVTTPTGTTPVCTGTDTAECTLPSVTTAISGYASMVFDAAGDLFFSSTNGGASPNSIFECTLACLSAGTGSATLIYQEPTSGSAQLYVGGLAVDSFGDVFFTDSVTTNGLASSSSNLKELVYTPGGGFGTTPIVLYTYTDATVSGYDDQLDAVSVGVNDTVYFSTEDEGTFALLNNHGVVGTTPYAVSTEGAKASTTDGNGNFYLVNYSNAASGDALFHMSVGLVSAGSSNVGVAATPVTNVMTMLNDAGCSSTPTATYVSSAGEFSAATTGACISTLTGAAYATTVNFTPSTAGPLMATLTATDNSGNMGTATATGTGLSTTVAMPTFSPAGGTYTATQTVTISDTTIGAMIYYTTDGSAPTASSTLYSAPIKVTATETLNAIAISGSSSSMVAASAYTINLPTAAMPTFSPAAGTYTTIQSVTIADATTGATIYYTTNGTMPTTSSMLYSGSISVSSTETLNAIAVVSGYNNSAEATAAYTINLPAAATPTFSPAAGTYTSVQSVAIGDTTAGVTIYYTTNGVTPTTSSTLYSGPISVGTTETLEAIAVASAVAPNYTTSATGTAAYTINLPAATPIFSPVAGTYTSVQSVTIADTTTGAMIYYTTNGTTPTTASTLYAGAITISSTETLEAIAVASGYSTSTVTTAVYTINLPVAAAPTFSPAAGTYTTVQSVTISDATTGAAIYYTTNGTTPTASSTVYSGPVTVGTTETLEAIAIANGYTASAVATAAYTINLPPASFTLSVDPGKLTIAAGQQGNATLTITPVNGFGSPVTFAVTGLPVGVSYTVTPVTVTPAGGPATTLLSVYASSSLASNVRTAGLLFPGAIFALMLFCFGFRKRREVRLLMVLLVSVAGIGMLAGCGSSNNSKTTQATLTITATSGSTSQTAMLPITIN